MCCRSICLATLAALVAGAVGFYVLAMCATDACTVVAGPPADPTPAPERVRVQCVYAFGLPGLVLLDASFAGTMTAQGLPDGAGVYCAGDVCYNGSFALGQRSGSGRLALADGGLVGGAWRAGVLHGSVQIELPAAGRFAGLAAAGALCGWGSLQSASSRAQFNGTFVHSWPHQPAGDVGGAAAGARLLASDGIAYDVLEASAGQGYWSALLRTPVIGFRVNCTFGLIIPECYVTVEETMCANEQCAAIAAAAKEITGFAVHLNVTLARAQLALAHRWPAPRASAPALEGAGARQADL